MDKIWLSKSTYVRSLQCNKSLYLYKNFYQYRDKPDVQKLKLFRQGHNIEEKVRQLFHPKGLNVQPRSPRGWNKTVQATKALISNGQPVVYEAGFNYKGVFCAVDIMTVEPDGITLFEIKRGSIIKEVYKVDVALQYYVIASLGYIIKDFVLVNYIGEDKDNLSDSKEDYQFTSMKEYCIEQQNFVDSKIRIAQQTIALDSSPEKEMGSHCSEPYKCDFYTFCEARKAGF